jgi:hypothetical protein
MPRALLLVALAACRLGFDPVDGEGEGDIGEIAETGAGTTTPATAQTMTAMPGSDFYTVCRTGEPCSVDCTAATTCIVECGLASSCEVACSATDCIVESCVAPACEVECTGGTLAQFGATAICSGT